MRQNTLQLVDEGYVGELFPFVVEGNHGSEDIDDEGYELSLPFALLRSARGLIHCNYGGHSVREAVCVLCGYAVGDRCAFAMSEWEDRKVVA